MDISRPVMSSALELACPHCGHADEDFFEFIDDNCLQTLHCPDCNQTGFFAVMECQACGAEQFFAWQASPSSQEFLALQCGRCGAAAPTCLHKRPERMPMSLLALTSQPDHDMQVAQIVRQIPVAADSLAALALLKEAAHRLGAEVSASVSFVHDDKSREMCRFLLACDAAWCIEYEQQAWYGHDPG